MRFQEPLVLLAATILALGIPGRLLRAEAATQPGSATAPSGDDPMEKIKALFAPLDLSDDQKTQLKVIVEPFCEAIRKWNEDHTNDWAKVKSEMEAANESKDLNKMTAAVEDFKTLMATFPNFQDIIPKIEAILRSDQKAKFEQKLTELMEQNRARK